MQLCAYLCIALYALGNLVGFFTNGVVGFFVAGVAGAFIFGLLWLGLKSSSELIYVQIDIEENTRAAAEALKNYLAREQ